MDKVKINGDEKNKWTNFTQKEQKQDQNAERLLGNLNQVNLTSNPVIVLNNQLTIAKYRKTLTLQFGKKPLNPHCDKTPTPYSKKKE